MSAVHADVVLRLIITGSEPLPVPAALRYDPADPYAVTVVIHAGQDEPVTWTFARELLADGLEAAGEESAAGLGDVHVWLSADDEGESACIRLSSPFGNALFKTQASEITRFLAESYALVPNGSESDRAHAELTALLGEATS